MLFPVVGFVSTPMPSLLAKEDDWNKKAVLKALTFPESIWWLVAWCWWLVATNPILSEC
jgi:hypothetical protein